MADVDINGSPVFIPGHRGMALAGREDATIEIRDLYDDNPPTLTYELWIASAPIDGLILADNRLAIEIIDDELSLTSRRDGSFLRFSPFPTDRFFHAAFLVSEDTATLYIDGISVESAIVLTEPPNMSSVFVTNDGEPGTEPIFGAVDDIRIWSRLLAPSEIAAAAARRFRGRRPDSSARGRSQPDDDRDAREENRRQSPTRFNGPR
jgi:hypothetical protein